MIIPITNAPLWYDVSSHQGEIKYAKLAEGPKVHGIISRAGVGLNKDVQFARNWEKAGEYVRYRSSYWAIWPELDCGLQLDRWYEQCPTIDVLPRWIDLEHLADMDADGDLDSADYKRIADIIWDWSCSILIRDKFRPWIYSRKEILDKILASWTDEQINAHYYDLAEYNNYRNKEEDGLNLPNRVLLKNCVLKQTADQIPPDPLGLAPESAALDRDRWLLGDEAQMYDWIADMYGGVVVNPPGDDCCFDMEARVEPLWGAVNANAEQLAQDDDALKAQKQAIDENADAINSLQSLIKTCGLGVAELAKRADTLLQGQLELAENGLGYEEQLGGIQAINVNQAGRILELEDKLKDITEDFVGSGGIYERLEDLEYKIEGMEGGHNHPKWMKRLGLVR